MLIPSCSNSECKTGRSRSKACSTDTREYSNRHTTKARAATASPRRNRSTAKIRRMTALRTSWPRRTAGAWVAGPDACASPGTNEPQRRQRHASPDSVWVRSCSRTPGSAGA